MSLFRTTRLLPRSTFRPTPITPIRSRFYAGSSYGGGEGDPKGENPLEQGKNPSEHLEHPGPPPPDVGKSSQSQSGSSSSSAQDSSSSSSPQQNFGRASPGLKDGARPKILDSAPPQDAEQEESVRQHNREFEQRHDRAENKINPDGKDNVGKGFWSGQGGADRQP